MRAAHLPCSEGHRLYHAANRHAALRGRRGREPAGLRRRQLPLAEPGGVRAGERPPTRPTVSRRRAPSASTSASARFFGLPPVADGFAACGGTPGGGAVARRTARRNAGPLPAVGPGAMVRPPAPARHALLQLLPGGCPLLRRRRPARSTRATARSGRPTRTCGGSSRRWSGRPPGSHDRRHQLGPRLAVEVDTGGCRSSMRFPAGPPGPSVAERPARRRGADDADVSWSGGARVDGRRVAARPIPAVAGSPDLRGCGHPARGKAPPACDSSSRAGPPTTGRLGAMIGRGPVVRAEFATGRSDIRAGGGPHAARVLRVGRAPPPGRPLWKFWAEAGFQVADRSWRRQASSSLT